MTESFTKSQADQEAVDQMTGELLDRCHKSKDPLERVDLDGEIRRINPAVNPKACLVLIELLKDSRPGDLKKITTKKDKAEALLAKKKAELIEVTKKLEAEIQTALENYRDLTAEHAVEVVAHNRFEALRTGIAKPGYAQYTTPAMRAWARVAKVL